MLIKVSQVLLVVFRAQVGVGCTRTQDFSSRAHARRFVSVFIGAYSGAVKVGQGI